MADVTDGYRYEAAITSGEPDAELRSCYDCAHCKGALSWWCANEGCREWRGTNIPGGAGCPYWAPCRTWASLSWAERLSGRFCRVNWAVRDG